MHLLGTLEKIFKFSVKHLLIISCIKTWIRQKFKMKILNFSLKQSEFANFNKNDAKFCQTP